jgi:hypothetical protein
MWRWRKMEIILTDRVKNDEVLFEVQKERECLPTKKKGRKANWIGDMLCRTHFEGKTRNDRSEGKTRKRA